MTEFLRRAGANWSLVYKSFATRLIAKLDLKADASNAREVPGRYRAG